VETVTVDLRNVEWSRRKKKSERIEQWSTRPAKKIDKKAHGQEYVRRVVGDMKCTFYRPQRFKKKDPQIGK